MVQKLEIKWKKTTVSNLISQSYKMLITRTSAKLAVQLVKTTCKQQQCSGFKTSFCSPGKKSVLGSTKTVTASKNDLVKM